MAVVLAAHGATTNDLRILSIGPDPNGQITLTWTSRPGEFYTVYAADALADWTVWRIVAARIHAAGDTTSWTDASTQAQRAGAALLAAQQARSEKPLSEEEIAALLEKWKDTPREYPPLPPKERPAWLEELLNSPDRATLLAQLRAAQQGQPTSVQSGEPPASRFYRVARAGVAGFVDGWGPGAMNKPAGLTNVLAVAASPHDSGAHSLVLLADGSVVAWGNNFYGQCNVPTNLTDVTAIAAGGRHSLALQADGSAHVWGDNRLGQVTNAPPDLTNVLAIAAGLWHSVALRADGTVVAWGANDQGQTDVPPLVDTYAVAAGAEHSVALGYSPLLMYPVDVSKDLLLIVNIHSTDSVAVLNYYLANRPGVSNANVLEVSVPEGGPALYGQITNATYEMCSYTSYFQDLQVSYLSWLTNHPTKRPRYVLMMYHVPSRWDGSQDGFYGGCVARALHAAVPGRKPFITHLNMGTVADCLAYIDKLKTFGDLYSPGKVVISASEGGYGNTNYLIDNKRSFSIFFDATCISNTVNALLSVGVPGECIAYTDGDWTNAATANLCRQCPEIPERCVRCGNIAAYVSWGGWGFHHGDWSRTVGFTGGSGWYVMTSNESWNGQWGDPYGQTRDGQYTFHRWFDSIAFRGTDYSNTPVGALTTVVEPGACYVDYAAFFRLWATGRSFGISAWHSMLRGSIQATGDPLVRR